MNSKVNKDNLEKKTETINEKPVALKKCSDLQRMKLEKLMKNFVSIIK